MTIQDAKAEIKRTIEIYLQKDKNGNYIMPSLRQRPILLIGPPGIGKTAIAQQIANELNISLVSYSITHHTRQSAIGLPKIAQKNYGGEIFDVTVYTMSEIIEAIYRKIEESGIPEGILFIDEINCASETLAPAMLQFLQCKTFGSHKVPKGWVIVSAGNPPDFNKSVRSFDIVTLDRVRKITIDADCDVWLSYAEKCNIHPSIIAYIQYNNDAFYKLPYFDDNGEKAFITARGWEDLSEIIKGYERYVHTLNINPENYSKKLTSYISDVLCNEFIQDKYISADFSAFFELYYRYNSEFDIKEALNGFTNENAIKTLKENSSDRFAVISQLYEVLKSKACEICNIYDNIDIIFPLLKDIKSKAEKGDEFNKLLKHKHLSEFSNCKNIKEIEELFSSKVNLLKEEGNIFSSYLLNAAEFINKICKKDDSCILIFSRRFTSNKNCFRCGSLFPNEKFNKLIDNNSSDKTLQVLLKDIESLQEEI